MSPAGTYKRGNLTLIDFHTVFLRNIETKIINDLHESGLINDKFKLSNKDTKAFVLHHVIFELCTYILKESGKNVVFFSTDYRSLAGSQLLTLDLIDPRVINDFLYKRLKQLAKLLPIRFIFSDDPYKSYVFNIQTCSGQYEEFKVYVDSYESKFTKYRFDKVISFAMRYNLTFLSADYFKEIKNKQLLIK